jgi:hypothetical protein
MSTLRENNIADPHELLSRRFSARRAKIVAIPPEHEILMATEISPQAQFQNASSLRKPETREQSAEEENSKSDMACDDPEYQLSMPSTKEDDEDIEENGNAEDDDSSSNAD